MAKRKQARSRSGGNRNKGVWNKVWCHDGDGVDPASLEDVGLPVNSRCDAPVYCLGKGDGFGFHYVLDMIARLLLYGLRETCRYPKTIEDAKCLYKWLARFPVVARRTARGWEDYNMLDRPADRQLARDLLVRYMTAPEDSDLAQLPRSRVVEIVTQDSCVHFDRVKALLSSMTSPSEGDIRNAFMNEDLEMVKIMVENATFPLTGIEQEMRAWGPSMKCAQFLRKRVLSDAFDAFVGTRFGSALPDDMLEEVGKWYFEKNGRIMRLPASVPPNQE